MYRKIEFGEEVLTTRSGFQTKKDAQQVYRQLQLDFDKNKLKMNGNITFKELYKEFIEQYRLKVNPSTTMITRRAIEEYVLEYFGDKMLKRYLNTILHSNQSALDQGWL